MTGAGSFWDADRGGWEVMSDVFLEVEILEVTLPETNIFPQKIGGPWNFGDSDWKASFSGAMLVLGTWTLFFWGVIFFQNIVRVF